MTSLTAEHFEALIDQPLKVVSGGQDETWRVTKVQRRESHALRSDQPFNLYLDAPASEANRAQGVRRICLDGDEFFDLFAVPVAANGGLISFEVIFN
jgi:hypothetical protein